MTCDMLMYIYKYANATTTVSNNKITCSTINNSKYSLILPYPEIVPIEAFLCK